MKNIPKKIYLQIDTDGNIPEEFKELDGITWCSDRINKTDIEYVLSCKQIKLPFERFCDSTGGIHKNDVIKQLKEYGFKIIKE